MKNLEYEKEVWKNEIHQDRIAVLTELRNRDIWNKESPDIAVGMETEMAFDSARFAAALRELTNRNIFAVRAACIDVELMLYMGNKKCLTVISEASIPLFLNLLLNDETLEQGLRFLGLLTFLTDEYSSMLISSGFLSELLSRIPAFPPELWNLGFTCLANLFHDVNDFWPCDVDSSWLVKWPGDSWSKEYIRLISSALMCEKLPKFVAEEFAEILVLCICDEKYGLSLKYRALNGLNHSLWSKNRQIVFEHGLRLFSCLENLLTGIPTVVVEILQFLETCMNEFPCFRSLLLNIDLCRCLRHVLSFDDEEIILRAFRILSLYVEKTFYFGENDLIQFLDLNFEEMLCKRSFHIKLAIVQVLTRFLAYLPAKEIVSFFTKGVIQAICDLFEYESGSLAAELLLMLLHRIEVEHISAEFILLVLRKELVELCNNRSDPIEGKSSLASLLASVGI
jgi:hypothetical protein